MSKLAELLERIEAATGPDRELDRDIAIEIGGFERSAMHPAFMHEKASDRVGWYARMSPAYTSSVDAALALVERVLPGFGIEIWRHATDKWCVYIVPHAQQDRSGRAWGAETLPLAILAAFLRALIAKEASDA